jgi:transposase InsO family protein
MRPSVAALVAALWSSLRTRAELQAEILALRRQLAVLQQAAPRRLRLSRADRLLWVVLSRVWSGWRRTVQIVKPATVVAWHRRFFAWQWRWRSLPPRLGRPPIAVDVRTLIQRMHRANPLWGAPRIHGELQKLGIEIAETTVAKDLGRRPSAPSPTWRTFLRTHLSQCASIDFFTVPTATFRVLFVLVILSHDRRRIVHLNVTEHPTAAWTRQQIREAFPDQTAPAYLIRDRDGAYGPDFGRLLQGFGTEEVVIAPRSPWQNPFVERLIGTLRRECLDHMIVWNERSLRRTLSGFVAYYHEWRPHLSLDKDAPIPRAAQPPPCGAIIQVPHLGGLHHHYERRAA